ncbi:MAG: Non-reducing end beta-L-arabinofuranosidase [Lentisphaerae bacterium ADurb.BinA184]|nr:MAG: Non-reducing end beta-L-arabinofuranosidase [Lentisphaerae bacterium ADurb.BinA184]
MATPRPALTPVPFTNVRFTDGFWAPRQEVNHRVTLPHQYRVCKKTGRLDALRLDWKPGQPNPPHIFWESDVAKWLEAAACSYSLFPDPALKRRMDEVAALIAGAQQPDGYINAHYTCVEPDKRWSNLRDCHELYCAGHLIEGAVAHFQSTGERTALDALCRYADYIDATFGRAPGKKRGYPGHEELELALVKLYRATGHDRYLRLARYFVDERGRRPHYFDREAKARGEAPKAYWARTYEYCQAHRPVREQSEVVGHAVRAFYLYSGMADVAGLTGDAALLAACRRLWDDATRHKLYLTGGVGPSRHNEGFTARYDLPNETAYAETCAAIAFVFFAHRMLQLEADGRYADAMERALYNGVLSGVSLDGTRFFYENPLTSSGRHHRQDWFSCACCPPNLARLLASLGQYAYSAGGDALYVHLYAGGEACAEVAGTTVRLHVETDYPWEGAVRVRVEPAAPARFDLRLRVPGWCPSVALAVNGRPVKASAARGYVGLRRLWSAGDTVELELAMPVERMAAHPAVLANIGKVALMRGPLVYCFEECDNPAVLSLTLPRRARLSARFVPGLLGGVSVIEGQGLQVASEGWQNQLYRPAAALATRPARIRAIPYYAWDNRQPGAMTVWLPETT